jgi:zinc D-Ala-D-Ala dipeptidase
MRGVDVDPQHPLASPGLAAVPIEECGEPLVDVRNIPALTVDPRLAGRPGSSTRLRSGVIDRLVTAQSLLPRGLRLLVVEGHRTEHRQREHFAASLADLAVAYPDWPAERVREEAGWHCTASGPAPHLTGGAADVTLCTPRAVELDLGCPVHAGLAEHGGACATASAGLSREAWANRRVLGQAMAATGLVNLPTAWWHWSFGDPYWALVCGARAAQYGPLTG